MTAPEQPSAAVPDPYLTVGGEKPAGSVADASRFRVLRPHARGNLGEVFVAHDAELHREVALKQIQAGHAHHAESRRRFLVEAEVTGGLEHPGIVPVYSLGMHADGRHYYAMRFIRGGSLLQEIEDLHESVRAGSIDAAEWSLRFRRLLRSIIVACQAVDYAHARGVIHRDLKPHNIMIGRHGETIVVDWGLAKTAAADNRTDAPIHGPTTVEESLLRVSSPGDSDLTMTGSLLGTPAYMSPEQAAGRTDAIGPASDIYSLGATLYHLLAGQPAFRGNDLGKVLQDVQAGRYPAPRSIQPRVSRGLEAITAKAMACVPGDRYASAGALADDIEHWLADQPFAAYRERPTERIFRWVRRHRAWTAAGFSSLAATALIALVAVKLVDDQRRVAHRLADEKTILAETERNERKLAIAGIHRARAGELAAMSRAIKRTRPELGVLLAIEGIRTTTRQGMPIVPAAEESLREALMEIGGVPFHPPEPVLALSPAGRWLVCRTQFFDMDAIEPAATGLKHGAQAVLADSSEDESRLALMAADGGVTVIDPNDSVRPPVVIPPQDGPCVPDRTTLRLSPNGRWLFVAADGTGRLHDLDHQAVPTAGRTGTVVPGVAATAVFSPDSLHLAIQAPVRLAAADQAKAVGTVNVWRLDDGAVEPLALKGGQGHRPLAFSPNSRELVSREGDEDSRVLSWSLAAPETSELIVTVPGETTAIFQRLGDRLVLTQRKGRLKGWRLLSRRPTGGWAEDHIVEVRTQEESIAVACSDEWLVASFAPGEIYAWNLAEELAGGRHGDLQDCILRAHRHRAHMLRFSRDGRRMVSVDQWSTQTWDFGVPHPEVINQTLAPRVGTLLARPDAPVGGATGERVMSPDGHWLAIDGEDEIVRVLDLTGDDPLRSPIELVGHGGKAVFHTFSRDSHWLATGGADHTICIWDLAHLPRGDGLGTHRVAPAVRFSTDGLDPACLCFGAESGQLWAAGPIGGSGAIMLWEWSPARPTGANRRAVIAGIAVRPRLAFSLNADALTVTMQNGEVLRHRLVKGLPVDSTVVGATAPVASASAWTGRGTGPLALSPDGRWRTEVAPGNDIDLIRIGADGGEVRIRLLQDREASFQCAAFSGDSELLATGFSDGSLRVWYLLADDIPRSGMALRGHFAPVEFLEFDRTDRWLVSSSPSTFRLWEMDVDRLIEMGRKAIGRTLSDYERAQFGIDAGEKGPWPEPSPVGVPGGL